MNKTEKREPVGISFPLAARRMGGTIIEETQPSQEAKLSDKGGKDQEIDSFQHE